MCNKYDRGNIYNSSSRAFREWAAGGSGFDARYNNSDNFGHKFMFSRDNDGFPIVQSPNSSSRMEAEIHRSTKRTTNVRNSSRITKENGDEHTRWPVGLRCEEVRVARSNVQSLAPKVGLGHSCLKNFISSHQDGVISALDEEVTHSLLRRNVDSRTIKKQSTSNGSFRFFSSVVRNKTKSSSKRFSTQQSNATCESHGDIKPGMKTVCRESQNASFTSINSTCINHSKNPTSYEESINRIRTKLDPKQILGTATNPPTLKQRPAALTSTSTHAQYQHTDILNKVAKPQFHRTEGSHKTDNRQQTQHVTNRGPNHESGHHSYHNTDLRGTAAPDKQPRYSQRTDSQVGTSTENKRSKSSTKCANNMDASQRQSSADRPNKQQRIWKTAVCPKTGKTYYYDAVTRQTQWHKPMELASKSERAETARKEKKQRDFFAAMEANILRSMAQGVVPGTPQVQDPEEEEDVAPLTTSMRRTSSRKVPPRPKLVRTISAMDDTLLASLTRVEASDDESSDDLAFPISKKSSPTSVAADINSKMEEPVDGSSAAKKPAGSVTSKSLPKPNLTKRNTCGTIYIGSTMSAPDKDASIKCVCGVFRAHLLQSVREETTPVSLMCRRSSTVKFDEYEIFNDHPDDRHPSVSLGRDTALRKPSIKKQGSLQGIAEAPPTTLLFRTETGSGIEALSLESSLEASVPSLDDITNFYRDVFRRSQMEADCIIMSLIYVERLIKDTNGGVRPKPSNWRSILFSCMVMSSKVWDDLSMWNADFSQTCPRDVSFSLQRINELELAVLGCLKYNVKVTASEYAKYYFLLRSMLIRSGLAGEDMTNTPLDMEGVKKLEHMSANYQVNAETKEEVSKIQNRRGKSMGCLDDNILNLLSRELDAHDSFDDSYELDYNGPSARQDPNNSSKGLKASLEHFVQL